MIKHGKTYEEKMLMSDLREWAESYDGGIAIADILASWELTDAPDRTPIVVSWPLHVTNPKPNGDILSVMVSDEEPCIG